MDVQREVEVKLVPPEGFVLPAFDQVRGVAAVESTTLLLRATYWDSIDLRLARAGLTLRHRTGEGRPCWTLKVPAEDGVGRWELTVVGPARAVPVELLDQVKARLRGDLLGPRGTLRTSRLRLVLRDSDGVELVEVVDDAVTVTGAHATTWRELEVEQRSDAKVARRVQRQLEEAGAEVGSQVGKAYRALGPASQEAPDVPMVSKVRRGDPVADLVRHRLVAAEHAFAHHDPGVRTGRPDALHQLRVAARTLRSDLRTFAPFLDDDRVVQLREELQWIGLALSPARDLEVLRSRLRLTAAVHRYPLPAAAVDEAFAAQEEQARAAALAALDADRYVELLLLLHDVATAPRFAGVARQSCAKALPPALVRVQRRCTRAADALDLAAADEVWHEARKEAKKARYASEAAAVALGKVPGTRAARRMQELLGEHQDAVVAAERCRVLAEERPDLAYTCGVLVEREHTRAETARATFLLTWGSQ